MIVKQLYNNLNSIKKMNVFYSCQRFKGINYLIRMGFSNDKGRHDTDRQIEINVENINF